MKISIIGGGNMGGAIACGLAQGSIFQASEITIIDQNQKITDAIYEHNKQIKIKIDNYDSLTDADFVVLAVKPWLVQGVLLKHKSKFNFKKQIFISIAAGISLSQLQEWTSTEAKLYRAIPNTAIAVHQSMTFVCASNTNTENDLLVKNIFEELGQVEFIREEAFSAATALGSCGIAFAFRYIRASMQAGVEMGLTPNQSKKIVMQTLRGAIDLLEANDSHPEAEIDRVTTPGGITIKGLNEMEHSGFSSSIIKGLKASNVK